MDILEQFKNPPKAFSPAPLWFWNGKLENNEISRQIDEMVDKKVYNAFMHPRAYLTTPYLEDAWWDVVKHTVDYSRKAGFMPWMYDEYAWPSGTAGSTFRYGCQKPSRVLAKGECNMAKGLQFRETEMQGPAEITAVFEDEKDFPVSTVLIAVDESKAAFTGEPLDITPSYGKSVQIPAGTYKMMSFYRTVYPESVDYLNKETIREFLDYTHEEYKKRVGTDFGSLIPGVFFDEIYMTARPIVWTDSFSSEFRSRKGYDIAPYLPYLIYEGGRQTSRIRKDYFDVLTALYEEAFFLQISDWCEKNHLKLTGHTEEWVGGHPLRQGNYFKTMRHLHIPGADCHDYRYKYPRIISSEEPKWSVSVARMYGKERCMSEAMGGGGWATSLQEFKRGINTLTAMGINMFILHGFYYETSHQGSQGDWPTSFFFQNPYWKYFSLFSEYISRVSFIGSQGKPVVDVGIYYPIAEVQAGYENGAPTQAAFHLSKAYNTVLAELVQHPIDADFIDEDCILRGTIENGRINTGTETMCILLLPACLQAGDTLLAKLQDFKRSGGHLLFYGSEPNETLPPEFAECACVGSPAELPGAIEAVLTPDVKVVKGENNSLHYCHRRIDERDFYFIANGCDRTREVTLRFRCVGTPFIWNLETGEEKRAAYYEQCDGLTTIPLCLQQDEALYIVFKPQDEAEAPAMCQTVYEKALEGPWSILPLGGEYDAKWDDKAEKTELEIPTALFCSDLNPVPQKIRICNREGENGSCGRHISLWKASWVTRRSSWADDSSAQPLYFRKKFEVSFPVQSAKLCIAAVNEFELYVNGKFAGKGNGWNPPAVLDIADFLTGGTNLLAVKVNNDRHIPGVNVLEAETLPADGLTSLLLQGSVEGDGCSADLSTNSSWISSDCLHDQWESPGMDYEKTAARVDVTREKSFGAKSGIWIFCWERGLPPLLPWGQLPLFGEQVSFPVRVQYDITLPAGTEEVLLPEVKGGFCASLDGQPVGWGEEGICRVSDSKNTHRLCIQVTAADFNCGLLKPIRVRLALRTGCLHDWCADGLEWFSGRTLYKCKTNVHIQPGCKYVLDLGQVNFCAEVWVNSKLAGTRIWKPYQVDVSAYLQDGENEICIVAANLAANIRRRLLVDEGMALGWNRYWNEDNIQRDAQNLVSGLLGPVQIICSRLY